MLALALSCSLAAHTLEHYARWRDRGASELAVQVDMRLRFMEHPRLVFDAQRLYTNPILKSLTPQEVRETFLMTCPREYRR